MSAGGDREETVAGSADLVVRNGRIHTGDPAHPSATDVAVRDGRIAAIGEAADVALLVGPATRVVDALGRRVIPGLNDSHLHVIRGGLNYLLELRWDGLPTLRQGLAMLREQAAHPKGPVATGRRRLVGRPVRGTSAADHLRVERRGARDIAVCANGAPLAGVAPVARRLHLSGLRQ